MNEISFQFIFQLIYYKYMVILQIKYFTYQKKNYKLNILIKIRDCKF